MVCSRHHERSRAMKDKWKSRAKRVAKEVGLIGLALVILAIYEFDSYTRKHRGRRR